MDIADLADKHIEDHLQMALAQTLANKNHQVPRANQHHLDCTICGIAIPEERLNVLTHCSTCVDCAAVIEQSSRLMGRNTGTWWW